jgi:hypothetical protein
LHEKAEVQAEAQAEEKVARVPGWHASLEKTN